LTILTKCDILLTLEQKYKVSAVRLSSCEQIGQAFDTNDEIFCLGSSLDGSQAMLVTKNNVIRLARNPQANSGQQAWLMNLHHLKKPSKEQANIVIQSAGVAFSPDGSRALIAVRFSPDGRVLATMLSTPNDTEIGCLQHKKLYNLALVCFTYVPQACEIRLICTTRKLSAISE